MHVSRNTTQKDEKYQILVVKLELHFSFIFPL